MENLTKRHERTVLPVRYLLVVWLFVLSAVAYLDRTNISIAGVQIARDYHVDNTHLGWVFSAFLIGYAAFQIPAGLLARRLGARLLLTLSVAWWSLFTILTALVPPTIAGALWILALVRLALGAGEATIYPAIAQFVERWFPIEERGKANGIIFGGVGIGSGLTPPLVTAIILHLGWRASFWFSAFLGLSVGAVWFIAARNTPEEHSSVSANELAHIAARRRLSGDDAHAGKSSPPWLAIFTSPSVVAVTLSYSAFGYVAWIFFSWFYIYMAQVRGLNLKASAYYSMLPFVAMTIGCLLGGVVSDWLAIRYSLRLGRCLLPGIALTVTSVLLVVGSRARSPAAAAVILALGAGVLYIAQSGFWAVTADIAGEHVGIVSGIMNMGAQIGGACTASLTPLIAAHFGWEMSFATAAAIALAGGLAWLAVNPQADNFGKRRSMAASIHPQPALVRRLGAN
jgi:ACS family glucarate transporter-like MFS transporter